MALCQHKMVYRHPTTKEMRCSTCDTLVGNDRCKVCGGILFELILLTSKTKYCKNCESKKSGVKPAEVTVPMAKDNIDDWLSELTELDIDELFKDIK